MVTQERLQLSNLESEFGKDRVQLAINTVSKFMVEVPSWIFGEFGGGRFSGYMPPGYARTIEEKLDDAAMIQKVTGAVNSVAVHVLWDITENGKKGSIGMVRSVKEAAESRGLSIGSVSPTYFLEGSYRGSLSADEKDVRQRYVDQTVFSAQAAMEFGSNLVTLWLPDGSLYPGQVDLRRAVENTLTSIQKAHSQIDPSVKLLIEYKVFEPGTYSTVLSDWGSAYMLAKSLGQNAGVLVDLGHHPYATNIEQIVARLIADGMSCGFHFNTRYAADDDHSVEPNGEMARIFYELVSGQVICQSEEDQNWAYMIDQCSGRENRMLAVLHSIDSLQLSLAKACLVDSDALRKLHDADQVIKANRYFNNALINADVRPLVQAARLEQNLPIDPVEAYIESGYQVTIEAQRK